MNAAPWPGSLALALPFVGTDVGGGGHGDPTAPLLLALAVLLVSAKVGGDLAVRMGQPAVLGELVVGVALGNLGLVGFAGLDSLKTNAFVDLLARLGVLLLLFEVGLDSTVGQMLKVGPSAFLVATLGVVAPFGLGWGVGALLLPEHGPYVHAFLGATLTATSVGITARVLKDLGSSRSPEARVILGAAVIDDVLGLVILAAVSGVIGAAAAGGAPSPGAVLGILAKALAFLVGSLAVGVVLSPRLFRLASKLRSRGVLLATALSLCFLFAYLADAIGLATIVGAFAAGLVLEKVHCRDFAERGERDLEELVHPVASVFTPVFFVLMGMRTDLRAFSGPGVFLLASALTLAAILGKQICGAGVLSRSVDRLTVGIGMIPRGEVGLIFANIGLTLRVGDRPIVDAPAYSAVVAMVIVTTLVAPPALKWSVARAQGRSPSPRGPRGASSPGKTGGERGAGPADA
ncbi:MAG TPA: cation:proton antiporter [Planctomycetota bacterium]|jgi:Kef-type K+ transport system membrane component KefB|nr:cation:proton antiporter [Planctomycetota bacterium]